MYVYLNFLHRAPKKLLQFLFEEIYFLGTGFRENFLRAANRTSDARDTSEPYRLIVRIPE